MDTNLDILRAFAVLSVLLAHYLQVIAHLKLGERFAYGVETYALGHFGVLIFFVHTALVLLRSLHRCGLGGANLFKSFYIRRVFRIYPLAIFVILFVILTRIPPNALQDRYSWPGYRSIVANLLLAQNLVGTRSISGPLWSLPFEVQMYLVLPWIFVFTRTSTLLRMVCLLWAALTVSYVGDVFQYAPCFMAGVLAYHLSSRIPPSLPSKLWIPWLLGLLAAFSAFTTPDLYRTLHSGVCLLLGISIPLFRRSSGCVERVSAVIAKYSYSIYLCHTPLLWLFYRHFHLPPGVTALCFILALCVTTIAGFYLIEQPLINMGKRAADLACSREPMPGPALAWERSPSL